MATARERPKTDATITMRVPVRTRDLIDAAAAVEGKSPIEFTVESAGLHAIDALLDQRAFNLGPDQSDVVAVALTNPAPAESGPGCFAASEGVVGIGKATLRQR